MATTTPTTTSATLTERPPPPLTRDCALFLDIDGTLLDLAPTPEAVRVDAALVALLPKLREALGGAVALVTGRSISDADRLFPKLCLPIAGQHGCERRDAQGTVHLHAPAKATLAKLRALFTEFASRHDGVRLEDKGATLALHYRQAPELAEEVYHTVEAGVAKYEGAFALQPGKALVEVRPDDRDKGRAICDFLAERPFRGRRPVFVGDDVGDEHGFSVVQRMDGVAVKVGPGRTRANYRLSDVRSVRRFLCGLLPEYSEKG